MIDTYFRVLRQFKNNEFCENVLTFICKYFVNTFGVLSYYFISTGATKNVLKVMNVRNINPSSVPRFYYLLSI